MKAIFNGIVIAESDDVIIVENNYYFPMESIKMSYLQPTKLHSTCHWKGEASYFDVIVENEVFSNAAWYYENPNETALQIKNRIAFWRGVEIVKD